MHSIFLRLTAAAVLCCSAASCTTVYDSYGRPHEVVDAGAAVVGAAAVGLLAYGLANSNSHDHYRSSHHRGYYGGDTCYTRPYRGSYGGYHDRGCRY